MTKYADGLDTVASALASATRRQILSRLDVGGATSSELSELTGVGLPTIAKHAEILAHAGLLTSHKSGRVVTHHARMSGLDELQIWIATRKSFWDNQFDSLEKHLEKP
ncbi:ArsR/SmtB family transcription factor [Microbacterium gorillae]|uniref:ArsR/SmtB family transcription factor n=1 Tax=Microbacterium gorillae TaxID=1231063 RepID=UPI000693261B|nr:helix-turn-helix domain-containing protein [Microbacterium gorillae]